ncbi:Spy/CpxP family protein refolding chaperone [Marinobacter sp. SS21]|uniref:Spy/CpxP family protein refolding chaperone n=1 Tax=Marinobacter sp. SS21 TaxID=2979460 RepID=UPI002330B1B8|nr:Spy/CpxP family protein refolding chaperone [Marinobacter sp. SS21]MDC0661589.1 Spy/CpxP family protein refolding chaperone [Marinobacter sp. SS21]
MSKPKGTRWLTPALLTATLLASPLALAGHHGNRSHHDKPPEELCERLLAGEAPSPRHHNEDMAERMAQRRADIADRLQLTEAQREIWDQIHEEHKAQHEQRREQRRERLMEQCSNNINVNNNVNNNHPQD